ncbi:hypothetical protein F5884DRAFT_305204 [Xylogone sp. PMI_703]|nr:hypothetical protein F5884DRAFT_305204 [Xylogone sp. PMI_703]
MNYIRDSYAEYLDEVLGSEESASSTASESGSEGSPSPDQRAEKLTTHICLHPGCKRKGDTFKSSNDLKKHAKSHNPPLQCNMCSTKCITVTHLERHLNLHTRLVQLYCPDKTCSRSKKPYLRWDNLKRHLKSRQHRFSDEQIMKHKSTLNTGLWRQKRIRANTM